MTYGEQRLAEQSSRWIEAIASVVDATASGLSRRYDLTAVDSPATAVQRELRVRPSGSAAPVLTVMCEEAQGFLSVDRVRGVSILYEFEDSPQNLAQLYAEYGRRSTRERTWLSEVDLVNHVIGFLVSGYQFVRLPFYEEFRIPGFGDTSELRWVNIDVGWPPFQFSKWRPSDS